MKKTKKALASIAIASMVMTMVPFNAFAAGTVPTRIAGVTAEDTAVKIADQTGYTATAILASSASYGMVDALTSGPLAAYLKAPILLTGAGNTLDAATKAELTKLAVKTVYVTSGTAVIKQGVLDELKVMGIDVISLGGFDRAETSVKIAQKMVGVTKVAIANGLQDALSIASVASAANEPILLTDKDVLPLSVEAFLKANPNITSSDIIGGTGIISDAVKAAVPSATRHYGVTAYDTNSQVIKDFESSLEFNNVYVANGVTGIDALAGAPLAAQTKSAIVLTDGVTVPAIAPFVFSKANATTVVTALGGEAVVPESIRVGVATGKIDVPVNGQLEIVSVSALDDTNKFIEIIFSKAVSGLNNSDITIENADTLDRYGVKSVQMSSDGLVATVELYSTEDAVEVLEYLQDYNVTVNANGTILKATFNRAYSIKSRVQDINVGDKEITVVNDKTGDKKTLEVLDSTKFDYQGALGELVQVWYNGDNEVTKYKILSTTAKYDAIEVTDDDEIKLLGEDKKYDISTEEYSDSSKEKFNFYLDGEKVDINKQVDKKFNFAKIGFDKSGDIEFVNAYALKDFLIVESIDGDEVVGIEGESSGSFDAEDATIVKDGKVIAASDLKKGDLLFFSQDADDEDGYAEVLNLKAASGEIDEVYDDSIEVDGETYDFDYDAEVAEDFDYSQQAVYIDEDGEVADVDSDAAEELQAAGDVTLYTDYAGNLIYISGDLGDVDSNSKVAVLTDDIVGYSSARDKVEIEALTEDEKELTFDISLESLDTITVDGTEYDIDNAKTATSDWTASLITGNTGINLKDNTGNKSDVKVMFDNEADAGSLVKLHLDDDGNLEELEFYSDNDGKVGYGEIGTSNSVESGDKYLSGKKLNSTTIMFNAKDDSVNTDADDYEVLTFGDYKGSEITSGNYIYNDDAEVIAIWFDSSNSSDNTYDEAVVTKILRNTDLEIVSLTVYSGGKEQTIKADKITGLKKNSDLAKGDVVILEFDEDNAELIQGIATVNKDIDNNYGARVTTGLVVSSVDVGKKKVTFTNGDTYTLADKGLVLDGTDDNDITIEALSDLRGETNVTVVKDAKAGFYAKMFVMESPVAFTTAPITSAIADANAAKTGVVISADATTVDVGTKWVTQSVNDALVDAIATATTAKTNAKTVQEVTDATAALKAAVVTYNAAKADGTKEAPEGMPTFTLTAEASELLGNKIVYVTLDTTSDTDYTVVVDGVELDYTTDGTDRFVGLLETSKSQAELKAATVVTK